MINKLFFISSLCCLFAGSCYADESSIQACKDCEDKDRFILVNESSKSQKKCPCEGNKDSENLVYSSSDDSSASSVSSESFSSSSAVIV